MQFDKLQRSSTVCISMSGLFGLKFPPRCLSPLQFVKVFTKTQTPKLNTEENSSLSYSPTCLSKPCSYSTVVGSLRSTDFSGLQDILSKSLFLQDTAPESINIANFLNSQMKHWTSGSSGIKIVGLHSIYQMVTQ